MTLNINALNIEQTKLTFYVFCFIRIKNLEIRNPLNEYLPNN